MKRLATPALITIVIAGGIFVGSPYAWVALPLAGIAAAVWVTSEVIRWQRR